MPGTCRFDATAVMIKCPKEHSTEDLDIQGADLPWEVCTRSMWDKNAVNKITIYGNPMVGSYRIGKFGGPRGGDGGIFANSSVWLLSKPSQGEKQRVH